MKRKRDAGKEEKREHEKIWKNAKAGREREGGRKKGKTEAKNFFFTMDLVLNKYKNH